MHEQAVARRPGPGEGALQVAEQFRLDHVARDRRAIDRHEGLVCTLGQFMDGAGGNLLTRAGLAGDQDRGRQRRDPGDGFANLRDLPGMADQLVSEQQVVGGRLQLVAQKLVFPEQGRPVQTPGHGIEQLVGPERLQDEIHGPCPQRPDRGFEIRVSRHQDRIGEKTDPALLGQPFDTVLARHDVVEDHHVIVMGIEFGRGFTRVAGLIDRPAIGLKRADEKIPHARFVVDDQDRGSFQPRPEFRFVTVLDGSGRRPASHPAPPTLLIFLAYFGAYEEISQVFARKIK